MRESRPPARAGGLATLAGLGAIALWAFLALLARRAATIPPLQLAAMSFACAAVLGIGVVAARGQLGRLRQRPTVWLHGVGGLVGYHALYFAALRLAPAAEASLINYCWPLLIVVLAAPILGLPLGPRQIIGAGLAAAGCASLLIPHGMSGDGAAADGRTLAVWAGDGMAFGAAVIWALYSLTARRLQHVPTEAVAGFCAASAVMAALGHWAIETTVWPRGDVWLVVLAMGAGPVGGAFFLWDIGMKRGDPRLLGTLAYATPVVSTLLLCLAGDVPWSVAVGLAAATVAAGGWVAARRE